MNSTGIEVLDRTVQKTNLWMKELMQELNTRDKHFAYLSFQSVLHALRDRMPQEEAVHLASQMPLLLAGVFMDGWKLRPKPGRFKREEFLRRVSTGFGPVSGSIDPERVTRAVFLILERKVTAGEIEDIIYLLPRDLRSLWPSIRESFSLAHLEHFARQARRERVLEKSGKNGEELRQQRMKAAA